MKFNSFIESLREKSNSQFSDNQLSTNAICIDQISHPINNDRRELFCKYAEVNDDVYFISLKDIMSPEGTPDYYSDDLVHPSEEGHKVLSLIHI